MSSKRAKRNTKSFKKRKRKERQDLRAGGRVRKFPGGYNSGYGSGYGSAPEDNEQDYNFGYGSAPGDNEQDYSFGYDPYPSNDSEPDPDTTIPGGKAASDPADAELVEGHPANEPGPPPADLNIVDDSAQQLPVLTGGPSGPTLDQLPEDVQEELTNINTGEGTKNTDSSSTTEATEDTEDTDKESDLTQEEIKELEKKRADIASGDVFTRDAEDNIVDDRFRTAATTGTDEEGNLIGITDTSPGSTEVQKLDEDTFTKAEAGTATAPTATTVTEGDVTTGSQFGIPAGYSTSPPEDVNYTAEMPPEGKIFVYNQETGARIAIDKPMEASTYTASTIGEAPAEGEEATQPFKPATVAAEFMGDPTKAELKVDDDAEAVVTAAAERVTEDEQKAQASTTDFPESGIPDGYSAIPPEDVNYTAEMPPEGKIFVYNKETKERIAIDKPTTSMVGPVTFTNGVPTASSPSAEIQNRTAITGDAPTDGVEAVIQNTLGYQAAQRSEVKGTAKKGAAADMVAAIADLPKDVTAAIVEDPAVVEAKMDLQPVEVQAAVAALPTEALVSSQMESLIGGLEDGNIPAWARPAVAAMNQRMAQRGLSVSTVGRDALFNAIIQSALPMAQSNAQALQTRAAQNLSNEQQANIEQSRQDMQRRLTNLANQQTAESQTAKNAQAMATLQSQFNQQAVLTTEQQQQQVRLQNLRNRQQEAVIDAQNQQAINAQELGNDQQMELANLQVEASRLKDNQAATNQERLAEMQMAANFLVKNAGFKQQMELANLSNEQQVVLANLTAQNQASRDNLNASQQTNLANLNATLQTNLLNAKIAENMGIAQLNVDQQTAIQNAMTVAKIDMAKFTDAQQVEIANSKFMQTMTLTDFNARQQTIMQDAANLAAMDMQEADLLTKISITNANNFLRMDLANLSNEQQANMLDSQQRQQQLLSNQAAENAASQFNATSENQTNQFMANLAQNMEQFNVSQTNAMEQFNATETNRLAALDANNAAEADKLNAQLTSDISKFNANLDSQREMWNAQNAQAVQQSNVEWRRKANMADTAAQNAVNAQNAQNAFALSTAANAQIWQELRDTAQRNFTKDLTREERTIALINSAMQSETFMTSTLPNVVTQRNNMYTYMNSLLGLSEDDDTVGGDRGPGQTGGGGRDTEDTRTQASYPPPPKKRTGPAQDTAYKRELAKWERENNITLAEYYSLP